VEGLRHILTNRRALLWWLATAAAWLGVAWLTDTAGLVVDGVPLIVAAAGVAFTAVQLGGPWLAAVTRRARLRSTGERFTDSIIRVFAGAAGALAGGSLMVAALAAAGGLDRIASRWGAALLAFFAGILVVSPFVRSWLQHAREPRRARRRRSDRVACLPGRRVGRAANRTHGRQRRSRDHRDRGCGVRVFRARPVL
jgi:hypothetical protein